MSRLWTKSNDIDEWLSAYLDGELTPRQARQLEQRLVQDAKLRARLDELRQMVSALGNLPTLEVPCNFILSPAMVKDARRQARRQPTRRLSLALSWATALATLLLVVVLAGDLWLLAPADSRPTESPASLAKGIDPERSTPTTEAIALVPTLEAEEGTPERDVSGEPTAPNDVPADASPPAESSIPEMAPVPPDMVEAPPTTEGEGQMTQQMMVTGPATVTVLPPPAPMVTASVAMTSDREVLEAPPEGPLEVPAEPAEAPVATAEPVVATDLPGPPTPTVVPTRVPGPTDAAAVAAAPQAEWSTAEATDLAEAPARTRAQEDDRAWLRVVEVGLGLSILGLLIATLVVRQRVR